MYVLNSKYWFHYYERENIVHPSGKSSSALLRLLYLRLYREATLLTPGMQYTIASITVSNCDKCITMVVWIGTSLLLKMAFISCSNETFRYSLKYFPTLVGELGLEIRFVIFWALKPYYTRWHYTQIHTKLISLRKSIT